jgi:hypothetical protein
LSNRVRHIVTQQAFFHNIKWTHALPP